jgi:hypothetical protein
MNTPANPAGHTKAILPILPLKSIGPVAAMLLILRLPLVAIAAFALRLTLVLLRPTLLILGVIKACDLIRKASDKR